MDADLIEALPSTPHERMSLRWVDGTAREVITTPGHPISDALGGFPAIKE